jgi:hypothetical protein
MSTSGYTNIVTDGLVFYIDAFNNKSYIGSSSVVSDLTINNNNGTLNNGVGFGDESWTFDGVNDYINIGKPSILNITTTLTIEVWFKVNNYPNVGSDAIVSRYSNAGGSVNQAWMLYISNVNSTTLGPSGANGPNINEIGWLATSNGAVTGAILGSGETVTLNKWYHVVATFDSPTNSLILYMDGILRGNLPRTGQTAGLLALGNRNIEVGATSIEGRYLDGDVSLVKFYNRTLSPEEVLQNYNTTKWRFE